MKDNAVYRPHHTLQYTHPITYCKWYFIDYDDAVVFAVEYRCEYILDALVPIEAQDVS